MKLQYKFYIDIYIFYILFYTFIDDPVLNIIYKFKNHPNLNIMKTMKSQREKFSLKFISYGKILTKIKSLDITKSNQPSNIKT